MFKLEQISVANGRREVLWKIFIKNAVVLPAAGPGGNGEERGLGVKS